jgi:FtsH-binding integral membrane protein
MTKETLKEAKNFRMQMKWCSIMCWVATLVFIFVPKTNNEDIDWVIIPIGATIFSLIYLKMNAHINEYEKLTEK